MYKYAENGTSLKVTERPVYGSSRLGSYTRQLELMGTMPPQYYPYTQPMQAPLKRYELTDHLGNVATVVTGRLLPLLGPGVQYQAEVVSAQGYEAFGSLLPGRNWDSNKYAWGLNGQLKDGEVYGPTGSSTTAEFWQYDSRTGRRWNLDPKPNPAISPYAAFALNPIWINDIKGDTIRVTTGEGLYLFSLDDGLCEVQVCTAADVYRNGTQWFEPLADNYMPLSQLSPDITCMEELKHFTWSQVAAYAETNRAPISHASGLGDDWKSTSAGADGYLLSEIEGMPYWSDAVGQIPYAVNIYKKFMLDPSNWDKTETEVGRQVMDVGQTFHSGFWSGVAVTMSLSAPDRSNTYDNYFIGRGIQYASERFSLRVEEYLNGEGKSGRRASLLGSKVPSSNLGKPLSGSQADRWKVSDEY